MDNIFTDTYLWAQIIGFCAMVGTISVWQLKNSRHIIILYIPVAMLWGTQYYLLGAMLGVLVSSFSVIKDCFVGFLPARYSRYAVISFLISISTVTFLVAETALDYLPLIATLIFNLSLFFPDNRELVARSAILTQFAWLAYNIPSEAWMGAICCVLVMISSAIGMARHEKWELGKCYRTFGPSLMRSLCLTPRTFP